jgi:hypothetical protein
MPVTDDSKIVELTSESTRNYESLIGVRAFDAMTPLLAAQVDILQARYANAILVINSRLADLSSQGLSRLSASLVADRAYCQAKLGDAISARADARTAIESVSSEDHDDDLAVLFIRLSEVYKMTNETKQSAYYEAKAATLWESFDSFRSRTLAKVNAIGYEA